MKSFKDLVVFKEVDKNDIEFRFKKVLEAMERKYKHAQEQAQIMEENDVAYSKHYYIGVSSGVLCCLRLLVRMFEEVYECEISFEN